MSIKFCPLYSGSSGNCTFFGSGGTHLLIDAGRSGSQIEDAMAFIGEDPRAVDAILVTHEHHDHVRGVGILARRFHIPIYATEATWQAMPAALGRIPPELRRVFTVGEDFYIGHVGIDPFPIPHDAADPCGFRLWDGNASVSVATDLGCMPDPVVDALAGSSLVLLESNYDPDLLRNNEHYRYALKKRIASRRGHLSNADCAESILQLMERGTEHFILGHLSGENNTPELAYQTNCTRLELEGVRIGRDVVLNMAWRERVSDVFSLETQTAAGRQGHR